MHMCCTSYFMVDVFQVELLGFFALRKLLTHNVHVVTPVLHIVLLVKMFVARMYIQCDNLVVLLSVSLAFY
jgi:hypothetical protein